MEACLIGIDVGTTGTKAMIFSENGRALAGEYVSYPLHAPSPGLSTQSADDWWNAVVSVVRGVCKKSGCADSVRALSLSTQGGTVVPVDAEFNPLCDALVWNDFRCTAERDEFDRTFGADYMYRKTGWSLSPGLNAMQIRHLRDTDPEIDRRAAYYLSVPDFIYAKMTGRPAVDLSNAGINQLADISTGKWDRTLLGFAGVDESRLAGLVMSGNVVGQLTADAAAELGLPRDTQVISGAHDQYAVAVGAGCTSPGSVIIGSGTAWVVTAITDRLDFTCGFAQSVSATPGRFGSLVSISTGGVCLEWLRGNILTPEGTAPSAYSELDAGAAAVPVGSNGLLFYPYFSGSPYPDSDPGCRAAFIGLELSHNRPTAARAVMEGVSCQIARVIEAFGARHIILSGGAAKSPLWSAIVAGCAAQPVSVPGVPDLACVGAAIIAGAGCGLYADQDEGIAAMSIPYRTVSPDYAEAYAYSELLQRYTRGASALGEVYRAISGAEK